MAKRIKIYTKTGDKGSTSLIGGRRVPKNHIRIEAYGTVDELIAHMGMLRDLAGNDKEDEIVKIQSILMSCAAWLASDKEETKSKLPNLGNEDIIFLENKIDAMDNDLEPLQNFILPGGNQAVSQSHICRTVCRRAERRVLDLNDVEKIEPIIYQFLNRLSDYLFTLSRCLSKKNLGKELPWKPQL